MKALCTEGFDLCSPFHTGETNHTHKLHNIHTFQKSKSASLCALYLRFKPCGTSEKIQDSYLDPCDHRHITWHSRITSKNNGWDLKEWIRVGVSHQVWQACIVSLKKHIVCQRRNTHRPVCEALWKHRNVLLATSQSPLNAASSLACSLSLRASPFWATSEQAVGWHLLSLLPKGLHDRWRTLLHLLRAGCHFTDLLWSATL